MVYKFKCPVCGRKCFLNKKLSDIKNRSEEQRVYQWECNGQSIKAAHPPSIFKVSALSIMRDDQFGKIITRIDKVIQLTLEDSNAHEKLDVWLQWMGKQQYKNLTVTVSQELSST